MKFKWVIQKRTSHLPSCLSTVFSPSKTLNRQSPFYEISTFVFNHVDVSSLLSICGRQGWFPHLGSSFHASILKNPIFSDPGDADSGRNALVVWNSLLSLYAKRGKSDDAVKLFDEMPMRDTVSWNTMLNGFLRNEDIDSGAALIKRMLDSDINGFDQATFTTVLAVCDRPEFCLATKMFHALAILSGYQTETTVGNALITSYFKCGCPDSGSKVFYEMVERNVITWTAVISGLAQTDLHEQSLKLFNLMRSGIVDPNSLTYLSALVACSGLRGIKEGQQIHALLLKLGMESNFAIESALMDMYSKCGTIEDAWKIFECGEEHDEVSMTVILVGLAQNGFEEEAIQFFMRMLQVGIDIDANVVSAVLGISSVDIFLALGKQLHALVIKRRFSNNPFVSNGLINMYSKYGELNDSIHVFNRMPERNSVSWNSMIAAFARHGQGLTALQLYEEMTSQHVKPTDVTFLSLLHACSHVGLVERGMKLLNTMKDVHGINPRAEHYACVVDMLGRAGLIQEAKGFVEALNTEPDSLVWQALLGACSFHGDTETGKYAAEQLILAEPESSAAYILMANIYSSRGKWIERANTIKRMKQTGVAKETGMSWIEINKKIHSFVVEDKLHPQAMAIYHVLSELFLAMVDEGYRPDKRFILYYIKEDEYNTAVSVP